MKNKITFDIHFCKSFFHSQFSVFSLFLWKLRESHSVMSVKSEYKNVGFKGSLESKWSGWCWWWPKFIITIIRVKIGVRETWLKGGRLILVSVNRPLFAILNSSHPLFHSTELFEWKWLDGLLIYHYHHKSVPDSIHYQNVYPVLMFLFSISHNNQYAGEVFKFFSMFCSRFNIFLISHPTSAPFFLFILSLTEDHHHLDDDRHHHHNLWDDVHQQKMIFRPPIE